MVVLCTILGLIVGVVIGFSFMCILSANRESQYYIDYIKLKEKYNSLEKEKDLDDINVTDEKDNL